MEGPTLKVEKPCFPEKYFNLIENPYVVVLSRNLTISKSKILSQYINL